MAETLRALPYVIGPAISMAIAIGSAFGWAVALGIVS